MQFRTQYDNHDRVYVHPGDPEKLTYTPQIDEHGHMELVVSGKENVYDYIQSHADSVDIHVILARFQRGDVSALSRVQGFYGDFMNVPKSYAELLNSVIRGEEYFMSLPVSVREKFGHNFNSWLVTAGSPDWLQAMGLPSSDSLSTSAASSPPSDVPAGSQVAPPASAGNNLTPDTPSTPS